MQISLMNLVDFYNKVCILYLMFFLGVCFYFFKKMLYNSNYKVILKYIVAYVVYLEYYFGFF